jgi:hypothetical protein
MELQRQTVSPLDQTANAPGDRWGRPLAVAHFHDAAAVSGAMRDAAVRATTAVGLGAIAVIHTVDSVGKWSETPYMFWMYMALIAGCIVTAGAVLFHRSRLALLGAAGLAASVITAFVIDRSVGMPNATGDIGNWVEPLGLASLVVEGFVVAIGFGGFLAARRAG